MRSSLAAAIISIGLIIAAMFSRYEIASSTAANGWIVYRLDRLTGKVENCIPAYAANKEARQPEWCKTNALLTPQ
jgi:hypothetical protein